MGTPIRFFIFAYSANFATVPFRVKIENIAPMFRKKATISLIALLFVAGIVILFFRPFRSGKNSSEAIYAIPIDAAFVVKIDPFEQLHTQLHQGNDFWKAMKDLKVMGGVSRFFTMVDSLSGRLALFNRMVAENQVFVSAHTVGNGRGELFFATNLPERVRPSDIWSMISDIYGNIRTVDEKEYNGVSIFTFSKREKQTDSNLSIAVHRGVIMASRSMLLVESAIGQLESGISLLNDPSFADVLKTAGTRVAANVLVNHNRLPLFFNRYIHPNNSKSFKRLSRLGRWSELDLTIRNDFFFLNGFGQVSDTLNTYYNLLSKQKPVTMTVADVLPAQTAAFVFLGISDINAYLSSYCNYLDGYGLLREYNQTLSRESKSAETDLAGLYKAFYGKELALAYIPFEGLSNSDCWFVVVNTKGQSLANQELQGALANYARRHGQNLSAFTKVFAIDREKSVNIYRFPISGMHKALFGNLFAPANDQYYTFIDSYAIFGSSVESLSRFILANIHNKQLSNEGSFKKFSEGLAKESNFTAFINPGKAETLYGQLLSSQAVSGILSQMEVLRKVQGMGIQLTGGRGMIFNNIYASYSPVSIDAPQTVWETKLDTAFTMKPQLVINHNTQQREIFVQDGRNNIYLINNVGRVLWKRPLQEMINGEVHQVDIFRNGKLQFLFSSKNFLFLVDRNGNNVEGFPVKLLSPATNPVAVFDYDGNRDYRFFIAGEDRKIYAYDRNGNVVTGWDFDRSEKVVKKPLQHFRVAGRDYIVFADENRPYILDRRGSERVKPGRFFSQAPNSTFTLDDSSPGASPRLVTTDSIGIVRFVYLNGKVEDLTLKKVSSNHVFDYLDINGDGRKDFTFLDGNHLYVYQNNRKELFSYKFPCSPNPQIIYFHFGAKDRKLGIMCPESSEIFLINGNGSLYRGFPLKGSTPFSIGQFPNTRTTFNLIVGSQSGFVLNYAVQ